MARRLKVFVVPAGFHDAYVAAPSRKAALEAWGSEHDLFARGVAQEVTDPSLMEEPLAHPGAVIKRSRGTTAEQIAALPPEPARAMTRDADADDDLSGKRAKPHRRAKTAAPSAPQKAEPRPEPPPKPSGEALEAAEQALTDLEDRYRAADAELVARQRALDRDRRDLDAEHERESEALNAAVATERDRHDAAIARWRKARGVG